MEVIEVQGKAFYSIPLYFIIKQDKSLKFLGFKKYKKNQKNICIHPPFLLISPYFINFTYR